jgi:hypothetical protein
MARVMSGDELGELLAEAEAKLTKVRGYVADLRERAKGQLHPPYISIALKTVVSELETLLDE